MSAKLRRSRDATTGSVTLTLGGDDQPKPLEPALVEALVAAFTEFAHDPPAAVILRADPGPFCAGFYYGDVDDIDDAELSYRLARIGLLLDRMYTLPCLTMSVVDGPAIGSGADLALACDVRIGTERARLSFPGPSFGLVLGTARVAAIAGADALRSLTQGAGLRASEAYTRGLLTHLADGVSAETLVAEEADGHLRVAVQARQAVLAATRPSVGDAVLAELVRSSAVPGIGDRVRAYVRRQGERAVARAEGRP